MPSKGPFISSDSTVFGVYEGVSSFQGKVCSLELRIYDSDKISGPYQEKDLFGENGVNVDGFLRAVH